MIGSNEGKTYMDFPRIMHGGKYAVVFDAAFKDDGGLYYGSWTGSRQMCEGIAAAMLDSGKRNTNVIYLNMPIGVESDGWSKSTQVQIAPETIGAMRRITRRVQGTRVWQVVLMSKLIAWDYNYAHIQKKNAIEEDDDSEHALATRDLEQRRFVLMAEDDEDTEVTARRWFGYLPRRVNEPLLLEWALPLWDYCVESSKGISKLNRLRGQAWFCEPSSSALREAVSKLGKAGLLYLPDTFSREDPYAYEDMIAAD